MESEQLLENERFVRQRQLSSVSIASVADRHRHRHLSSAINDFDLHTLQFTDYGKEFPKQHNMSPDAFVQMCLQFTYFK